MKILITGGYGFIGRHCARALGSAGHSVVCGGRGAMRAGEPGHAGHMQIDFMRDFDVHDWRRRLNGIDVVINAVGAIDERGGQNLEAIHVVAPRALFYACVWLNIRVINISALGADEGARTKFHITKKAADDYLLAMHGKAVVLQPSLVFGVDGESSRLFMTMASLPLVPLIGEGRQLVQPVHVDDLAKAVTAIVAKDSYFGRRIPIVGPAPLEMRVYLQMLRTAMGLGRARFLNVPAALAYSVARAGFAWATPDMLQMLERGNTANPAYMRRLLGEPPRAPRDFIERAGRPAACVVAKLAWLAILLRLAVAFTWIATGILSAGVFPIEQSTAMVAAIGLPPAFSAPLVYLGAGVDIGLGIATLWARRRRRLWLAQIAVIVAYTGIITLWLPEFWLHPFGPLVKNIPLLATIYALYELERR